MYPFCHTHNVTLPHNNDLSALGQFLLILALQRLDDAQVERALQLHLACMQRIGVIIVGPSGSGKSTIWRLLQTALATMEQAPILHVVNPKAMPRHQLLGRLFVTFVLPIASCLRYRIFEAPCT